MIEEARAHTDRAIDLSRQLGDSELEGRALGALKAVQVECGQLTDAIDSIEASLSIARSVHDRHGEAAGLVCLAELWCELGRYALADEPARDGLALGEQLGERRHVSGALEILAIAAMGTGRLDEAENLLGEAHRVAQEINFQFGEISILLGFGRLYRVTGRSSASVDACRGALDLIRESGRVVTESRALTELSLACLCVGDVDDAAIHAERALELARSRGQLFAEARALGARAEILRAMGDIAHADLERRAAEELFAACGVHALSEL